jgi:pimeloyl-ACP methyl ester carboxylesterase/class 3 adenylate cyclase
VQAPRTHYAKSGDVSIAYQVVGDAPLTLVHAPGYLSHVEIMWEDPHFAQFITRLSTFARVVLFDKRGTGASDREGGFPTLDDRMDDIRAVMDAVGVRRAALFGVSEGGNMSTVFAATYPERVSHLILFGCFAKRAWSPDYPWAPTPEKRQAWIDEMVRDWDKTPDLAPIAPSRAHEPSFAEWFGRMCRMAASPGAAKRLAELNTHIDVRGILPAISVPTLVLQNAGDVEVLADEARYIADHVPGARLTIFEGADHIPWTSNTEQIAGEIEEFITGVRGGPIGDTTLSTILCTDIVGSTARRASVGDADWSKLIGAHDAGVRAVIRRQQGVEINTTGDGVLAAFSSPGRALSAAFDIQDVARSLNLPIRAGVHTGECRRSGAAISGIAVDIAVRVASHADAQQVFASRTVRDLTIGAGFTFEDAGTHVLKGAPGEWQLLQVSR